MFKRKKESKAKKEDHSEVVRKSAALNSGLQASRQSVNPIEAASKQHSGSDSKSQSSESDGFVVVSRSQNGDIVATNADISTDIGELRISNQSAMSSKNYSSERLSDSYDAEAEMRKNVSTLCRSSSKAEVPWPQLRGVPFMIHHVREKTEALALLNDPLIQEIDNLLISASSKLQTSYDFRDESAFLSGLEMLPTTPSPISSITKLIDFD